MSTVQSKSVVGNGKFSTDDLVAHLLRENERLQSELNAERGRSRLFQCIFNCSPEAMVVTDPGRRIQTINDAFGDLFGYQNGEIEGETTLQLYAHEEDYGAQGRVRLCDSATERHAPYLVEYKTERDRHFVGETIAAPVVDHHDELLGYVGIIRNVSLKEASSAEVREKEQLLQLVIDALPELVAYIDVDGRYRFVNTTAEQWYNRCRSEIVGKRPIELLGEADDEQVSPLVKRAINGETVRSRESIAYPDGKTRTVDLTFVPDFNSDGTTIGFIVLVIDVTEQTSVANALEESKQRIQEAIEAIPDAFAYYDCDDRLTIFNQRYRSLHGTLPGRSIEGATFEEIIRGGMANGKYQDAIGNEESWIEQRLKAHKNPSGPIEIQLDEGRWMRIDERKTRDGGVVGVRIDITELKKRELELKHLSRTDHLTGIGNRRDFLSELKDAYDKARRSQGRLSVLLIDADHFKTVNDTYGHAAGDEVLKQLAQLIKDELRPMDGVFRYGGEEFAVLLPNTSIGGAFSTAERIRCSVRSHRFEIEQHSLNVTISIGVTQGDERDVHHELALARADDALYEAKDRGRDRVVVKPQ